MDIETQPTNLSPRERMRLLFRVKMYREYASYWDNKDYIKYAFVKHIIRESRSDCLRKARQALEILRNDR